ncbi:MAG: hypothetical protein ACRDRK_09630 [Pseudonocardia sp.]
MDALHPFREGNGRATRAFLLQLAPAARLPGPRQDGDVTWMSPAPAAAVGPITDARPPGPTGRCWRVTLPGSGRPC